MRFDLPTFDDSPVLAATEGVPLQLPIADIDEDPQQPRREFDDASLQELAATIADRGVRQPVSVRPHPDQAGRWMLNFGARRLRASILAGRAVLPAFVDLAMDNYDQVIENEQREGLKPLELALFIERQLATGVSQAEIARRLGKSRPYITMACALIDAPDWLMAAYREGKCRGLTELYELRRLHGTAPGAVERMVADRSRVARSDIEALRSQAERSAEVAPDPRPATNRSTRGLVRPASAASTGRALVVVTARLAGHDVRIDTDALPFDPAEVFVWTAAGEHLSVPIDSLTSVRLSRGG